MYKSFGNKSLGQCVESKPCGFSSLPMPSSRGKLRSKIKQDAALTLAQNTLDAPSKPRMSERMKLRRRSEQHLGTMSHAKHESLATTQPTSLQRPKQLHPAQLAGLIKRAASWQELMDLRLSYGDAMNHIHVSAMLSRLAHMMPGARERPNHWIPQAAANQQTPSVSVAIENGRARKDITPDTDKSVRSAGQQAVDGNNHQQQADPGVLIGSLVYYMTTRMHAFENRQLANCMWSIAKLNAPTPASWVSRCFAAVRDTLHDTNAQQLSMLTYAIALRPDWLQSLESPDEWLQNLFSTARTHLKDFGGQELSNFLWAAAKLHLRGLLPITDTTSAALTSALELACQRHQELKTQEQGNVLWAAARLAGRVGSKQQRTLAAIQQPSAETMQPLLIALKHKSRTLTSVTVASSLLSIAYLQARPPRVWVRELLHDAQSTLSVSKPQELSNILLALAHLGYMPEQQWFSHWCQSGVRSFNKFSSQELANTAWSLSRLGLPVPQSVASGLLLACSQRMAQFTPQELAMLLQSLSQIGCKPPQAWMQLLCSTVYDRLHQLHPEQLGMIVWSLARMSYSPPAVWLQAVTSRVEEVFTQLNSQSLSMIIAGLAQLRYIPSSSWLRSCLAASQRTLPDASVKDMTTFLWGLAMMDVKPGDAWLKRYMHRCTALLNPQLAAQQEVQVNASHSPQHTQHESESAPSATTGHVELQEDNANDDGQDTIHMGEPAAFRLLQTHSQRVGKYKSQSKLVYATHMWTAQHLQRMEWALTRLGYTHTNPHVSTFLQRAKLLDTAHTTWRVRQQHFLSMQRYQNKHEHTEGANASADSADQHYSHTLDDHSETPAETVTVHQAGAIATDTMEEDFEAHNQVEHRTSSTVLLHGTEAEQYLALKGVLEFAETRLGLDQRRQAKRRASVKTSRTKTATTEQKQAGLVSAS